MELASGIFKDFVGHAIVEFSYFSGISLLIPNISSYFTTSVAPWQSTPWSFWFAVGLVFFSISLLLYMLGSVSRAFKIMGVINFISGIMYFVFIMIPKEQMYSMLQNKVTGFAIVQPAVDLYIKHSFPQVMSISLVYIVLGLLFWKIGQFIYDRS